MDKYFLVLGAGGFSIFQRGTELPLHLQINILPYKWLRGFLRLVFLVDFLHLFLAFKSVCTLLQRVLRVRVCFVVVVRIFILILWLCVLVFPRARSRCFIFPASAIRNFAILLVKLFRRVVVSVAMPIMLSLPVT